MSAADLVPVLAATTSHWCSKSPKMSYLVGGGDGAFVVDPTLEVALYR